MKKLISLFMFIIMIFTLSSCGEIEDTPTVPDGNLGDIDSPNDPSGPIENNPGNSDNPIVSAEVEYVVSLIYNKKVYMYYEV